MPFCLEKKGLFVFVIELGEMFFFLTVISCMPTGSFKKYYIFLISLLSTTWICSKRRFVTKVLISLKTQRVISLKKASFCSCLFAQEGHLVAIFFFYMAILVENGLLFISTHKNVALEFYQQCVDHNFCFSIIPFFYYNCFHS